MITHTFLLSVRLEKGKGINSTWNLFKNYFYCCSEVYYAREYIMHAHTFEEQKLILYTLCTLHSALEIEYANNFEDPLIPPLSSLAFVPLL